MNSNRIINLNLTYKIAVAIKNVLDHNQSANINEACTIIEQANLSGTLWSIKKCRPSTKDDPLIFVYVLMEDEEWMLEVGILDL